MNILASLGFTYVCKNPKKIYIYLPHGVGDIVLVSPTVEAIRKKYPSSDITYATKKGIYYDIIANDPNIDKFHLFDQNFVSRFHPPVSKNVIKYIVRFLAILKNRLLLNMKYDLFLSFPMPRFDKIDYTKHQIDYYAEVAGVSLKRRRPIIYLNEEDISQSKTLLRKAGVQEKEPFIVMAYEGGIKGINPNKPDHREWDGFPELVRRINQKYKIKILTLLPKFSEDGPPGTIRIKDEPTIRAGAAIIKQCSLYIGIDCGLTHIASAFDIEIVSIHQGYPIDFYGCVSPHNRFVNNEPFLFYGNNKEGNKKPISVDRVMKQVEISLQGLNIIK